jgi:[ribosomal protein S5]-alanine N-acetyltransferase
MTFVREMHRLTLDPVSGGDEDFLITHRSDPSIRRFLFDATPALPDEIAQTITESIRDFATLGYRLWLIRLAPDRQPIGAIGLRPLDDLGLEIFYSLTPASWGHGYATKAAGGVIEHALGPLGLTEVFAEVDVGNTASAAVIDRLAMEAFATVQGCLGPMTRYRKPATTATKTTRGASNEPPR